MSVRLPVVFLPGLLCDYALWAAQIQTLYNRINPLVADLTQGETMADLAAGVLAASPPQFGLVGLSMGGYVAFEIMRQAPERVVKLALFDTSARPDTPEQRERRLALLALSKSGHFKGVTPRLLPLLLHPDHLENQVITSTVMSMAERLGRDAFHRQQTAILNRVDSRPSLPQFRCKTLVAVGDRDALTPPETVREIAAGISGSEFHVIAQAGHLPPLEQPEQTTGLIARWLAL